MAASHRFAATTALLACWCGFQATTTWPSRSPAYLSGGGTSTLFTGVAGALSAIVIGFVAPESFTLFLSISFLVGSAIGGIATIGGAIVGGIFIQFVPNLANDISDAAPSALYGVAMLLFMYAMPHGVVGTLGPLLTRSMLRIQARWPALLGK